MNSTAIMAIITAPKVQAVPAQLKAGPFTGSLISEHLFHHHAARTMAEQTAEALAGQKRASARCAGGTRMHGGLFYRHRCKR